MIRHRATWMAIASIALAGPATAEPLTPTRAAERYRQAVADTDAGRYAAAAAEFSTVAQASSALRQEAYYAAATNFLRSGESGRGFEALAAAVSAGYRDADGLRFDPDLDGLRADARWPALVAQAKRNDAEYRRTHADPQRARLVTADIEHLLALLPLPAGDDAQAARMRRLESGYFDLGSPGLSNFLAWGKIVDVDMLAGTMGALPRFYGSLGTASQALDGQVAAIRGAMQRLKAIYPAAVFPDVYFVVGHFRSGGTSSSNGLIIGTEIYSRTPGVVLDEIPESSRGIVQPTGQVAAIVIHELTHCQQPAPVAGATLLRAAIAEGTADFVAALVLPETPEPDYRAWGYAHDALVKQRFRSAMDGTDMSDWIANNDRATPDWPAPLGYYVGFRIAKGYYDRAADKRAALRQLLELRDPQAILQKSGYLD